ncbi:acyltransferase [Aquella oligotrophica]|uniref:N-acetyltransferase n=1 Tax=Aquella oligotrophica TaxID=2067065 RepID=A0A2I7N2X5_9NEIS|nr:acyltransferase [Aquella oligotrophica]AUR50801.1 N-acetyltransferase [Aquella oligotrophica]
MSLGFVKSQYAIIDDGVEIGNNTKIGSFSQICRDAIIGQNCNIRNGVYIASNARIGNNVTIGNNVSIYGGVSLQDYVYCGSNVVFINTANPRIKAYDECKVLVKHGAVLGANSTILNNLTIGEFAFIGAGTVVRNDVLPYAIMVGVPARRVGWMCVCGTKLKFTINFNISERHVANCKCGLKFMIKDDKCILINSFD